MHVWIVSSIGFEEQEYRVFEDEGSVEICIVLTGGLPMFDVVVSVVTSDIADSAISPGI